MTMTPRKRLSLPLLSVLALAAFIALAAAPAAEAQINPGRLQGELVDEEGNPVKGVTLLLTSEDGGKPFDKRTIRLQ